MMKTMSEKLNILRELCCN